MLAACHHRLTNVPNVYSRHSHVLLCTMLCAVAARNAEITDSPLRNYNNVDAVTKHEILYDYSSCNQRSLLLDRLLATYA